ncbi:MAG: glutamine--fructose-6-phosphate transaminase (isomerizing) [Anaerolineae bacterium]
MCGIVGYAGSRTGVDIVLEGLERLEYRGYDSAGIAVLADDGIRRCRSVGRIRDLAGKIDTSQMPGGLAMGHTRWATHGAVTEDNCHPHIDGDGAIALVQNGIVENYRPLKASLEAEGITFRSQTDTEVIAHLVSKHYEGGERSLSEAVRLALAELEGPSAIVVMSRLQPSSLVAARLGHAGAVVIGLGEGENLIASDTLALLAHTRRVMYLEDGDVATVTAESVAIVDREGHPIERPVATLSGDPVLAAKQGYRHFMLKEIYEQPQSLTDALRGRVDLSQDRVLLSDLARVEPVLPHLRRLHAVACGTAWHACLMAKFMIEDLARLPVEVDYGSEFRYRNPLLEPGSVVLVITQSGETVDTLAAMETARERGMQSIALVNVPGSQAARLADGVISLNAGPEIGVASTKAFTSQVTAALLLAIYLGSRRGTLDRERRASLLAEVSRLPSLAGGLLADGSDYATIARRYMHCNDFLYLGRGMNYPIALEGALKLKEISYIHAEGYPAGEMKHGPIALIDEDFPTVAICPDDRVRSKMLSNIEQVKARGGRVIAVATEGDYEVADKADDVIWIPRAGDYTTGILAAIPLQLFAYHMAVLRGCDVDQPRNLAKSVTVE